MDHRIFDFKGQWKPIDEAARRVFRIYDPAAEVYVVELSPTVSAALYRPSNSLNWIVVFRTGEKLRFSDPIDKDYLEAKNLAERMMVGFSIYGERSIYMPLL